MVLPFRASWQTVIRPSTSFPPPPLFIPYGGFSLSRAGSQPCPPAPFRNLSGFRLTQELPFTRFWPFLIQASGTAAVPTGPWLSTVYHVRACKRYYGLIRQSDELRPAWLYQLTLAGLCLGRAVRLTFPSLLCHTFQERGQASTLGGFSHIPRLRCAGSLHAFCLVATTMPLAWIVERLNLGTRGHLAWLLQQRGKSQPAAPANQRLLRI